MLEYRRYRDAAQAIEKMFVAELPYIYRSAPLPAELRRAALKAARQVYEPETLGAALGDLLTPPPEPSTDHIRPTVSLQRRLGVLREALGARPEARLRGGVRLRGPAHPGRHPVRAARDAPARRGDLEPEGHLRADRGVEDMNATELQRNVEALLFLSPEPVAAATWPRPARPTRRP